MEPFEREVVSDLDEHTDDRVETRRRIPLHVRILLGLVAGATLGSVGRALLGPGFATAYLGGLRTSRSLPASCFCARC